MRPSGVHHLTFTAILDALTPDGAPSNAWAVATLRDDGIDVEGAGAQPSRTLRWPRLPGAEGGGVRGGDSAAP